LSLPYFGNDGGMIRLRQACLVAHDRDEVVGHLEAVFGIGVAYNDPHIHRLGLHNAVLPVGDQFIEVVSPITENTTAERYLNRRGGDGGYMLIFQTDDFASHRTAVDEARIRIVADYSDEGFTDMQLHPADTGGTFIEIDQQVPPEDWHPAGPDWRRAVDTTLVSAIVQADVGCSDAEKVSPTWGHVMQLPVTIGSNCGMHKIRPHEFCVRFVPASQRGDGLEVLYLRCANVAEVLSRAQSRGLTTTESSVVIGGVTFELT
jgi:hypothetical protein